MEVIYSSSDQYYDYEDEKTRKVQTELGMKRQKRKRETGISCW